MIASIPSFSAGLVATATDVLPAAGAPTAATAAGLPASPATTAPETAAAQFERALQRILLGSPALADSLVGQPAAAASSDSATGDTTADKDDDSALDPASAPVADLLLSGMLLPYTAPTPVAPAGADAGQAATAANGNAVSGIAAGSAAAGQPALAGSALAADGLPTTAAPAAAVQPQDAAAVRTAPRSAPAKTDGAAMDTDTAPPPTAAARPPAPTAPLAAAGAAIVREQAPAPRQQTATDSPSTDAGASLGAPRGADIAVRETATTAPAAAPRAAHDLVEMLGDRIALQSQRGSERAVIRLDPPMQGQLEITIRHDASGATQVHLTASNGDVVRQLQNISDSLRQELVHRQAGEVTVQVSQGGREQDGRQRQQAQTAEQDGPGRALGDAGDTADASRFALSSHLD